MDYKHQTPIVKHKKCHFIFKWTVACGYPFERCISYVSNFIALFAAVAISDDDDDDDYSYFLI